MAGVLQFTLGLATGGFLSNLGAVDARVKGFLGSLVGLGAMTEGVMKAFEKGAALEKLAKRSGETAETMYLLQKGFEAAGASGDDVSPILFQMQRSLGGVNEMGESTADVFHRMGLSVRGLKAMSAPEQLQAIFKAMGKLGQSDAAKAASSIFGRQGAQTMLQMSRSSGEFAEGLAHAAAQAKMLGENAAAFERLERTVGFLKDKTMGLFAGIAAGLAPGLQAAVDALDSIDLSGLGKGIGEFLTAVVQAFKEGNLSELIGETLKAGFDLALAAAPAIFEKLGFILLKVFETPLTYLQAGMEYAIDQAVNNPAVRALITALPGGGVALAASDAAGLTSGKKSSFEDILAERKESGLQFNMGTGDFGLGDINSDSNQRWDEAKKKIGEISKPLLEMIDGLVARAGKVKGFAGKKGGNELGLTKENYRPEFTSLEKMGFVMSGVGNPAQYARETADNTRRTADGMEQLLENHGDAGLVNQPA